MVALIGGGSDEGHCSICCQPPSHPSIKEPELSALELLSDYFRKLGKQKPWFEYPSADVATIIEVVRKTGNLPDWAIEDLNK